MEEESLVNTEYFSTTTLLVQRETNKEEGLNSAIFHDRGREMSLALNLGYDTAKMEATFNGMLGSSFL